MKMWIILMSVLKIKMGELCKILKFLELQLEKFKEKSENIICLKD